MPTMPQITIMIENWRTTLSLYEAAVSKVGPLFYRGFLVANTVAKAAGTRLLLALEYSFEPGRQAIKQVLIHV